MAGWLVGDALLIVVGDMPKKATSALASAD